jgi:hypothetical protein
MKKVSRKAQSERLLKAFMKSWNTHVKCAHKHFVKNKGFDHLVNPALRSTQAADSHLSVLMASLTLTL